MVCWTLYRQKWQGLCCSVGVDHLQHISEGEDCIWSQPHSQDIQDMDPVRIVPSAACGERDISWINAMFLMTYSLDINKIYEKFY